MPVNSRKTDVMHSQGPMWTVIPFSFQPNVSASTSNPLSTQIVGPVSVSFAGTGLYNVSVLGGGAAGCVLAGLVCETALKGLFQVDAANNSASNGTFQIRAYTYGTTTLVNFTATTSVQRVHGVIYQQCSSYTR